MANIKFSALPAAATPTGTETTVGLQSAAAVQFSPYTTQASGDTSLNLATTAFVAAAIAPLNPASAVNLATTTVLPNTPTYNNGTAGVGATLTAGSNTTLTVDSVGVTLNQRVLVKNQASTFQNGIYSLTQLGSGSVPWILTRATDYNSPQNINYTGTVPIIAGTVNAGTNWLLTSTIAAVGSPNAITYVSQSATLPKGTLQTADASLPFGALITGGGGYSTHGSTPLGTANQVLTSNGAGTGPTFKAPVSENTQTTDYTLVIGDANNLVNMNESGAGTLTIPANASVAFPVGTIIGVTNTGGGVLTIAITADTLNQGIGGVLVAGSVIAPIGSVYSLVKTGTTTWLASGNQGAPAKLFISSQTVSGSSTGTVTFNSGIPAGYNNLVIRCYVRILDTTSSSGLGNIYLQLNGDTTTGHYTAGYNGSFQGTNGVTSGSNSPSVNGEQIAVPGNSYNSNVAFSDVEIVIHNYNQTANHISISSRYFSGTTTGSAPRLGMDGFNYTPSAVITSLTLTALELDGSTASDFAAGSFFELYAEL